MKCQWEIRVDSVRRDTLAARWEVAGKGKLPENKQDLT